VDEFEYTCYCLFFCISVRNFLDISHISSPLYFYFVSKKQDVPKHDNPYYWVGVDDIKVDRIFSEFSEW
jgi:hypothetical protein